MLFFVKEVSSKCSCGQKECSFDYRVDTFQGGGVNFFHPKCKKGRKLDFFPKNPQSCFMDTKNVVFKTAIKKIVKRPTIFGSMSKKDEKHNISNNKSFPNVFLGRLECSFDKSVEMFFKICRNFFAQDLPVSKKIILLGKKSFFLGLFLWTRSYKNSQPRRNFSGRGRKTLQQRPKVIKWYFFLKKLLQMFLWTGRMQFWQPRRYFSGKRRNFFPLNSKNDGN